jgi:DNA-binding MarR family transcriptional regulator
MAREASSSLATPEDRLGETMGRVTRAWLRVAKSDGRELDLSLPQIFLVVGLREKGRIPVTRWAETMGASPSATTGLLDGLEAEGYLLRTHDPLDRRQVLISLSPKGARLAARLEARFRTRWRQVCEGVPAGRLADAEAVLERLADRLEEEGCAELVPRVTVEAPSALARARPSDGKPHRAARRRR